eukprot:CAMPEP_0113320724 /NCGR_PEP_ID=MMETSP0010_2-20120614/14446_1 /TAXON_ID=216773 ORGANISM="Corethron hystrix, Strain 308" /NCGR_SAMPLE_ID=MMETSP0010_2 /ASSEMBLY_ACC=CAM_ASM_000155 /LENGTH=370 /DNA_ID=CAMNT_0000178619 /DNA_START=93 /DNA_END=1205 /DNA_ORIENTATION=+ /assembly_acc=CAM_ASM_000155
MSTSSSPLPQKIPVVVFIGDAFVDVQTSPLPSLPIWDGDVTCSSVSILPGGSVANSARHYASLFPKHDVRLLVTVGDDLLGRAMIDAIEREGVVSTKYLETVPCPMSTCVVLVGPEGKRAFVSTRGDTSVAWLDAARVDRSGLLEIADHVHVSGLFSVPGLMKREFVSLLAEAKERRNFTFSLDTQYDASNLWGAPSSGATDDDGEAGVLMDLIQLADVFVPNHVEAVGISNAHCVELTSRDRRDETEEAAQRIAEAAPNTLVVVKAGKSGALVVARGLEAPRWVPCPKLEIGKCVDTCGAGDCFAAAMMGRIVEKMYDKTLKFEGVNWKDPSLDEVLDAVAYGCKAGTWCCMHVGACARPVSRDDLLDK